MTNRCTSGGARPPGRSARWTKPTFQEPTQEIEARSEEAVVEKQARVVGEVVVTKETTEHEEAIRDTVRRTEVDVEKLDAAQTKARPQR